MQVELAYGRTGLCVDLPDHTDVIRTRHVPGLPDEHDGILSALRAPINSLPLAQNVKPGDRVAIVHSDITRATPNDRLLPVILAELEAAGIARHDIVLLNALGTHRRQTDAELRAMLGDSIVDAYRCEQHDAFDEAGLVPMGVTSFGNPVRVNRRLVEADVRIFTGFIEPHFFAGFSGGPKGVLPAMAGAESVLSNHGRTMVGNPKAAWGVTEGNPIWEEMREAARMVAPTFLVNVTLNSDRQITGVFAGEMFAAHKQGCNFVRQSSMVAVDQPYDIVVTTNSGYPLDQNLYQCVKGMSAASQIVRDSGSIIMAGACADGLPDHGRYAELLQAGGSPKGILDMIAQPGFSAQDQWQVQIQAHVQLRADVWVRSDGLSDEQIRRALFLPCTDISRTVAAATNAIAQRAGQRGALWARICAMPEGPQTVAYLANT